MTISVQRCAHLDASAIPDKGTVELQRNWQSALYQARGGNDQSEPASNIGILTERIRFNLEAIHQELAELRDHLPWKNWKTYSTRDTDPVEKLPLDEIIYEAVDIQHFLNNIYLALGLTDEDVSRYYYAKVRENLRRQERGY